MIKTGKEVKKALAEGLELLELVVGGTLGARGGIVVIEDPLTGALISTKDGATAAKSVASDDPFVNAGVKLGRDASKASDRVGDGTTTATVIANAIIQEVLNLSSDKSLNYPLLARGMKYALTDITEYIDNIKFKAGESELRATALTSANGDKLVADLAYNAVYKIGVKGSFEIEQTTTETYVKYEDGFSTNTSVVRREFLPPTSEVTLKNPFILVSDLNFKNISDISDIVNKVLEKNRPIIIFVNEASDTVIGQIITTNLQKNAQIYVVTAPGWGDSRADALDDLAVLTASTPLLAGKNKWEDLQVGFIGEAASATLSKTNTRIKATKENKQNSDLLNKKLADKLAKLDEDSPKYRVLQGRMRNLGDSHAKFFIKASSEQEFTEVKHRLEDAVYAVQSAKEDGVVEGGGVCLALCSFTLSTGQESEGYNIVMDALNAPMHRICFNGAIQLSTEYFSPYNGLGYNVITGEEVNMLAEGIMDSAKVVKEAVKSAVNIAASIVNTNAIILSD